MSLELADADRIAAELVDGLRPYCHRIEIAGSVRRRKPVVKDIEIVCVPIIDAEPAAQQAMFAEQQEHKQINLLDQAIKTGDCGVVFRPRSFGPAAKTLFFNTRAGRWNHDTEVQLDLFSVIPPAQWGVIFMIRTGSGVGPHGDAQAGFGPAMLARWKAVGGFRCEHGTLHHMNNTHVETPEETDVFNACRVSYVAPELRTDAGVVKAHAIR